MIIDFKTDCRHAGKYTVLDAETGRCLDQEKIHYADSNRGYYDVYASTPNGLTAMNHRTGKPISERKYRRIAIFKKPQGDE